MRPPPGPTARIPSLPRLLGEMAPVPLGQGEVLALVALGPGLQAALRRQLRVALIGLPPDGMEIQVVDEVLMCAASRRAIRPRLHGYVGTVSDVRSAMGELDRACRLLAVGGDGSALPPRVTRVDGAPMVACDRCLACLRSWLRELDALTATGRSART